MISHRGQEQSMDNFRQQDEDNEQISNFDFMNDRP
jgi:hypothetical protein